MHWKIILADGTVLDNPAVQQLTVEENAKWVFRSEEHTEKEDDSTIEKGALWWKKTVTVPGHVDKWRTVIYCIPANQIKYTEFIVDEKGDQE